MISSIISIDFEDITEAVPAYLAMLAMPLMYSISEGIALGVISYVVINLCCGKAKKIKPLMYILAVLFVFEIHFLIRKIFLHIKRPTKTCLLPTIGGSFVTLKFQLFE